MPSEILVRKLTPPNQLQEIKNKVSTFMSTLHGDEKQVWHEIIDKWREAVESLR
jgi:hypothetical protein